MKYLPLDVLQPTINHIWYPGTVSSWLLKVSIEVMLFRRNLVITYLHQSRPDKGQGCGGHQI